jgi:hypothetical protein
MSSSSLSIVGGLTPEQSSRDKLARLAGLLYFSTLPTGALGLIGAQSLLEKGGLAAVPQIVARRLFLELGVLSGALCVAIWLVVAVLFYVLFRSVGDRACKLLVVFALVGCTLLLAAIARRMDALSLVAQSRELALGADQLRVQVALALRSSDNLNQVSAIFWGLWLAPLGFLVFRSGFLPRTLGVLLMLGAIGYVALFAGTLLQPQFANTAFAQLIGFGLVLPGTLGELGTALWLLFRGTRGGWGTAAARTAP